jgi:hypothetical protein
MERSSVARRGRRAIPSPKESTVSTRERVKRVLLERGVLAGESAADEAAEPGRLVIEDRSDGTAIVRLGPAVMAAFAPTPRRPHFPVNKTLQSCADHCADAGFLVALLRDDRGVYVSVS